MVSSPLQHGYTIPQTQAISGSCFVLLDVNGSSLVLWKRGTTRKRRKNNERPVPRKKIVRLLVVHDLI
jgi:hypothetical protein